MNRHSDVGRRHHPSTTCCHLGKRRNQSITQRRRSNKVTSNRAQKQEQPVNRINSGECRSSGFKLIPRTTRKNLQVRSRFEALRTDDEEFPITDEHDDPGLPEAVAKKRHQGGRKSQTCKYRSATTKPNARDKGNKTDLCPLERGKMLGNTEEGEEWKLMPRPLVIDSGSRNCHANRLVHRT